MFHQEFSIQNLPDSLADFKQKALQWADSFHQIAYYESNQISFPHSGFQNFLGVSNTFLPINLNQPLDSLQKAAQDAKQVLCCLLSYELKNNIETLSSRNPDKLQFPKVHYFHPEIQIHFTTAAIIIQSLADNCGEIFRAVSEQYISASISSAKINLEAQIPKEVYISQVKKIKERIWEGDVYELNYCQEFHAAVSEFNPITAFAKLNQLSPMPFAGLYKLHDRYLLCASPERFLKKEGNRLVAQPIKGTIRRGHSDLEDAQLKKQLATDEKEIAENMMIMDLMRNDLARCSLTGSVKVEEMFCIYQFRQVYQMITTIVSRIAPTTTLSEILRCTFPMGSMTGAPKIQALRLIDEYEAFARGLYAGSMGYIYPNGDFDFNVVIRSMQYNRAAGYLSCAVGSAITYDSDPEKEYQECLLKAEAIVKVLQAT